VCQKRGNKIEFVEKHLRKECDDQEYYISSYSSAKYFICFFVNFENKQNPKKSKYLDLYGGRSLEQKSANKM